MSTPTPTSLPAYLASRAALIAQESSLRLDSARHLSLTPTESAANDAVLALRAAENVSVWQVEEEKPELFPGMHFLTSKEVIERTRLFGLLKTMPKGAVLHAHMDAMCDARFLLSEALKHPNMHILASSPLPTTGRFPITPTLLPSFLALPPSPPSPTPTASIFSPSYPASTWIPLSSARESYPGGLAAFDDRIIELLTIAPGESYTEYPTSSLIWQKFQTTFLVARGLLGYEPIYRAYIRQLFLSLHEDGVSYVETRINFLDPFMVRADGTRDLGHAEWVGIYKEVLEEVKKELGDEFWGAKIIYTTIRFIDNDSLRVAMEDCISLKKAFPDLIAGFDLVGHEDPLHPLIYYMPSLLWFLDRQAEEGLEIPYIFHAGETLGSGTPADDNLYDALLLRTKRLGHAFSLSKHPLLMRMCREEGVCVECCPVSNEILRYTPSILNHPIQTLINNGVPVALSPDDPQVFGNMGLTYDFYQVLLGSSQTTLLTLSVLAEQSIVHSRMDEREKERCLGMWRGRWGAWVEGVVKELGGGVGL